MMTTDDKIEGVVLEAERIDDSSRWRWLLFRAARSAVTYRVAQSPVDRRRDKRRPIRLQSGKALDGEGRFIVDFSLANRGAAGVALTLARAVQLPRRIWIYEDVADTCRCVEVIWQSGLRAGGRITPANAAIDARLLARYRRRYYAAY